MWASLPLLPPQEILIQNVMKQLRLIGASRVFPLCKQIFRGCRYSSGVFKVRERVGMGRTSVCSAIPALNNLMDLEESLLGSMTAVECQGGLSGYLSLALWCLLKY